MGQGTAPSRSNFKAVLIATGISVALIALPLFLFWLRPFGPRPPDFRALFPEKRVALDELRATMANLEAGTLVSADSAYDAGTTHESAASQLRALDCYLAGRDDPGTLRVMCYSWGMAGSGIYLGYYFSAEPPKLKHDGHHGAVARPLDGGWYLYDAN